MKCYPLSFLTGPHGGIRTLDYCAKYSFLILCIQDPKRRMNVNITITTPVHFKNECKKEAVNYGYCR